MKETTRKISSQKRGFLNFLRPLMSVDLLLMKNVLKTLAKNVLIPLGLTATASGTDAAIQKKVFGSGMTALIISNKEMEDIIKIVKSLEELSLITEGVSETIKEEAKKQIRGSLGRLLGTLATSILGNMLAGKHKTPGKGVIRAGEEIIRAGERVI